MKEKTKKETDLNNRSTKKYINNLLDTYFSRGSSRKRTSLKKHIRSIENRKQVINQVKLRIANSDGDVKYQAFSLGLFLDRKEFLADFLEYIVREDCQAWVINTLLQRFSDNPLSDDEQIIVAHHIVATEEYDVRLLGYIHGEALDLALDGILKHVKDNKYRNKHLNVLLGYRPDYLNELQATLCQYIETNPSENRNLIRYLDFSNTKCQSLINFKYNFLTIFQEILKRNTQQPMRYYASQYFSVSIPQKILYRMELSPEELDEVKELVIAYVGKVENIEDNRILLKLLNALSNYDYSFSETLLISLHQKASLHTNIVLDELKAIKSAFAYRELLRVLMTTEDQTERFSCAITLIRGYPDKANLIIEHVDSLGHESLAARVRQEVEALPAPNPDVSSPPIPFTKSQLCKIISPTEDVNELLFELANEIGATEFHAAVGFAFASGVTLLAPLINYINKKSGSFELIIGALQNYMKGEPTNKIDKRTVRLLNQLIAQKELSLYTYEESFFHGKYFCISNEQKAYVIIGSTNISKTAFFNNYEVDVLFELNLKDDEEKELYEWFRDFKSHCVLLKPLDENRFADMDWNSELDVYSAHIVQKITKEDMQQRIDALDDEETKFRFNLWMSHSPSEMLENLEIPALEDYIAFIYAEHSIVVFESFIPNNAYYPFHYTDFDQLLKTVIPMSKLEMAKLTCMGRGYHTQDKIRLKDKIDILFKRSSDVGE